MIDIKSDFNDKIEIITPKDEYFYFFGYLFYYVIYYNAFFFYKLTAIFHTSDKGNIRKQRT